MSSKAAITVLCPRAEVERLWRDPKYHPEPFDAPVTFRDAPGDRGTEIHVEVEQSAPAGILGEAVQKVRGTEPLAKAKDGLRHFKQLVETGEIARSDASPEGERLERKLHERPAQPAAESELQRVGG